MELKQLEEIFNDLNLSECFGTILTDSTKKILELENKIDEIKKENAKIEKNTTKIVNNAIEEQVRPIARRKRQGVKDE